jgi:hypothetical protein
MIGAISPSQLGSRQVLTKAVTGVFRPKADLPTMGDKAW